MEKAKAAQEAAKAAGPSVIKHKPVEKLTKRERLRLAEEAKAQRLKTGKVLQVERSRSGTPVLSGKPGAGKKSHEPGYQGTMKKKAPEPLAYKGTLKLAGSSAAGSSAAKKKKLKGQAQDKYGGYASWSDLDDAEDEEEEEGYESGGSSDMEGGYDDVEHEEMLALRAAKKEDQAALQEEERLKREKAARQKRLQELSKSAAARKKY